jgi:shikimate dehydrogenase
MTAAPYAEVIGDPIRQSKSPVIHGFWLDRLGLAGTYRATHVTAGGLAEYLAQRRDDPDWRGCNVTMPHKQAVIGLIDRLDPLAVRVGAVNTIVPEQGALVGYNTDVPGFAEPLLALPRCHHACVLGTGGAARAIIVALADQGLALMVAGRDPAKARALLDELALVPANHAVALADLIDPDRLPFTPDLVVNATALGMVGQPPLPFAHICAAPEAVVYDIVTAPADTALLQGARGAGLATIDGLAMLIGQADHAFRRFFGARPPRGEADHDLRRRLAA